MATKILLIDDHPMFRIGMQTALESTDAELQLIAVGSIKAARPVLQDDFDIALILLDVLLFGENGLVELPKLRAEYPALPVIVLTGLQQLDVVEQALADGAQGFISKSQHADEIVRAIRTVLDGGKSISVDIMESDPSQNSTSPQALANPFKPRLNSILAEVALGKPNKIIARDLALAETTVRDYVSEILATLNAKNRTEAVAIARARGWL